MVRILFAILLTLAVPVRVCLAQASPYSNNIFKPQTFTGPNQTGTAIQLNGLTVNSTVGSSYATGTITLTGVALSTVTFAVQGSADNGVTYFPLAIAPVSTPTVTAVTATATSNSLYQVNLSGMTHVRFVTSGTFTATSVTLILTATPNGTAGVRGGGGGGGVGPQGPIGPIGPVGPPISVSATDGSAVVVPNGGQLIVDGASIASAYGNGGVHPYGWYASQHPYLQGRYTLTMLAVSGSTIDDVANRYPSYVQSKCQAANAIHPAYYVVDSDAPYNSIATGASASATYTKYSALMQQAMSDGCRVVAGTIREIGNPSVQVATQTPIFNSLVRNAAINTYTVLADWHNFVPFDSYNCPIVNGAVTCNAASIHADFVHFKTAGDRLMGDYLVNLLVGQNATPVGLSGRLYSQPQFISGKSYGNGSAFFYADLQNDIFECADNPNGISLINAQRDGHVVTVRNGGVSGCNVYTPTATINGVDGQVYAPVIAPGDSIRLLYKLQSNDWAILQKPIPDPTSYHQTRVLTSGGSHAVYGTDDIVDCAGNEYDAFQVQAGQIVKPGKIVTVVNSNATACNVIPAAGGTVNVLQNQQATFTYLPSIGGLFYFAVKGSGGGGGSGVSTFNNRSGAVTPQDGDYNAKQVGAIPLSGPPLTYGLNVHGDSIAADTGASTMLNGFAHGLQYAVGGPYASTARPNDSLYDMSNVISSMPMGRSDVASPITVVEIGTNSFADAANTSLQNLFKRVFTHAVYYRTGVQSQVTVPSASLTNGPFSCSTSGSWAAATPSYGSGLLSGYAQLPYVSTTNGSTLTCTFNATATANTPVIFYPVLNGNGGTWTVTLDGTAITDPVAGSGTTFYNAGDGGTAFAGTNSAQWASAALRIPAVSNGAHTLVFTASSPTSSSNIVAFSGFMLVSSSASTGQRLVVSLPMHRNDANDTASGTLASYESSIAAQAASDGLNVFVADVRSAELNTNVPINLYVANPGTSRSVNGSQGNIQVRYAVSGSASTAGTPLTLDTSGVPAQGHYTYSNGTYTFNAADAGTPLFINYTLNCGATLSAVYSNCYSDALHPNDYLHALMTATILASLPAPAITGNNLRRVTATTRDYITYPISPQTMMTPNGLDVSGSATNGFAPGIKWRCYTYQCSFTTYTQNYGVTNVVPFVSNEPSFSVASYSPNVGATGESTLTPYFTISGTGLVKILNAYFSVTGNTTTFTQTNGNQSAVVFNNYGSGFGNITGVLHNTYDGGYSGITAQNNDGSRWFSFGVGNTAEGSFGVAGCGFFGQTVSGTSNLYAKWCPSSPANFSFGVATTMYQESLTTPASSTAPCTAGQFTDDANFHYVCTATNTWKRAALSAF